jgi:hypothetical protein
LTIFGRRELALQVNYCARASKKVELCWRYRQ